jgi:uncharacterized protein (DUF58 family)
MSGLRPAGVTRPFTVLASMTVVLHVISRTTGSGWLVVVVSGLLAVLGLSVVLPALALALFEVGVRAPTDAVAGTTVTLDVNAASRAGACKLRFLAPEGPWVRVLGRVSGPVAAVPRRRGVVQEVEVEVRSAAPFGLLWWQRRLRVPLEHPMEVGPAPAPTAAPPPEEASGAATPLKRFSPDLVRGLRDYVPGDPQRLVSWMATARHGRLVVRELEGAGATAPLILVVDLRGAAEAAEAAASRAAGLAQAALREGRELVLATAERTGPRAGTVSSALEVSRRLARATGDGPPAAAPRGGQVHVVRAAP